MLCLRHPHAICMHYADNVLCKLKLFVKSTNAITIY